MNKSVIEWDARKAESNRKKHGIRFEEAATVLLDPLAITFVDPGDHGEPREISIGHSVHGNLLLVVHLEKGEGILRIISARKATRRERADYEKGI
ncbi:MAG: BrnT family toxin [Bdellovibrionales bacterium]|nr:BrnT family toxin [Bdellovibrionales bacterium]